MKIIKEEQVSVREIVGVLKIGGLVIMPTETMYGAMVEATNPLAVERLTKYKNRPFGKPYSIAVDSLEMAEKFVEINQTARNLYKNFLPGPLTVVSRLKSQITDHESQINSNFQNSKQLAAGVASEKGTVGVRIPDYKLVIDVIKGLGNPITATSANASYKKRPYTIDDILKNLSEKQKMLIDLIIDAGELPHHEPSTVVDTTMDEAVTLRQGEIEFGNNKSVVSRSEEETRNIGKDLWQKYEQHAGQRAIIFALEGQMGAGKTQFTKGLAKAMGIEEEVTSPTFNLENIYEIQNSNCTNDKSFSKFKLSHVDAWRLQEGNELEALGLEELISDKSVVVIEWADRVAETIRKYNEEAVVIWVKIGYGKGENERIFQWTAG